VNGYHGPQYSNPEDVLEDLGREKLQRAEDQTQGRICEGVAHNLWETTQPSHNGSGTDVELNDFEFEEVPGQNQDNPGGLYQ
jgi:hypothetical protein